MAAVSASVSRWSGYSITQEVSSSARTCSGTATERVVVDERVGVADVPHPGLTVRRGGTGYPMPCQEIGGPGKQGRSEMADVRYHVSHRDTVPGDDESFACLDPVKDFGVVVPQLPLRNDRDHHPIVALA